MIVVKQLLYHCSSAFGCHAELYQSQEADVLIAVFPPTKRRGWWTYVTLELYRVGASECLMYSYKFERDMITLLAHVADQVMRNGENRLHYRLQPGEVFPLESPVQEASCLDHVIVTPADYEEDGFDYFTNGAEVISFMMLHAIAESEANVCTKTWIGCSGGIICVCRCRFPGLHAYSSHLRRERAG